MRVEAYAQHVNKTAPFPQAWKPDVLLSENIVACNAILASASFLNVSMVNFWCARVC